MTRKYGDIVTTAGGRRLRAVHTVIWMEHRRRWVVGSAKSWGGPPMTTYEAQREAERQLKLARAAGLHRAIIVQE